MDTFAKIVIENRAVIEVVLFVFLTTSTKIREVIAIISEMLQAANNYSDEDAMKKAISLLRQKLPMVAFMPDIMLKAMIQWFFDGIKKQANKQLEETNKKAA